MMRKASAVCGALLLIGCQDAGPQYQELNPEDVGQATQALEYPTQTRLNDAALVASGLAESTYKDIAASATYFYALTTTGIKRVTHANIGTIASAAHLVNIQLDAIDYANATYGVVGARSKRTNPNAVLVLKADTASPVTVNLPTTIGNVTALESRVVSSSVIRLFVKTPKSTVGSTLYEYEYNGSTLTLKSQIDVGMYTNTGFTVVGTNTYLIGWSSYIDNYAFKFFMNGTPSVSEAQNYIRTYPGGETTSFYVHGFTSGGTLRGISPIQLEYAKYNNATDSVFALTSDTTTGNRAIVRLNLSQLNFVKTPAYTPTYWNVSGVQGTNNCYNYGTNRRTDTFAQPGEGSGNPMAWPPASSSVVANAAVADGLEYLGNPTAIPVPPEGKSLVAAIVGLRTPLRDYHWYRKDRNSQYWTHKPGSTAATNLDQKGAVITDPRTAAWNTSYYDTFVGFFLADSNWYEGMGNENIQ